MHLWNLPLAAALICAAGMTVRAATTAPATQPSAAITESPPAPPPLVPLPAPVTTEELPPPPVIATTLPSAPPSRAPTTQPQQVPAINGQLGRVLVTSDLDLARVQIAPALGATAYTVGPNQIQSIPGGENAPFQQVLLQSPSVAMDSFGQEHVRGEHANTTYRVNGVLLPQPISEFGQELDTRLIDSVTLIDGTLPAQFGFHTAAIIDVTTKTGESLNGSELSIYGGSYNTFEPSFETGGTSGKWDYFVTGTYKQSDDGIENPTASYRPIHDQTSQQRLFTYLSYHIDDTSRLTFLINGSNADFQIPNVPGAPNLFTLAGYNGFDSTNLNETQNEQEYYGVVAYQKSEGDFSMQASAFTRYGQINFEPDPVGDLILQGVAGAVFNNFETNGLQVDSSYKVNDEHTLRVGFLVDYTVERQNTNTQVFPVDPTTGAQSSDVPVDILDNSRNDGAEAGVYAQDEWHFAPGWTLNYGARFDAFDANFDNESQLSPRVNLVWQITKTWTYHVGYARYFVTPLIQYESPTTIEKFANTTNAPQNFIDDPIKCERSNYYDMGLSHQFTPEWSADVDGFYKQAHNLIDEGQFGDAVIFSDFNYAHGLVYGAETSTTYKFGGLSAFANFAWVLTQGQDIDSQQFFFDNAELAYIQANPIKLDHESEYTMSAGTSYSWQSNTVYVDFLSGSGLRSGFANLMKEPAYYPINVGYTHQFHPDGPRGNVVTARFDVVNLFDEVYQIRSGTGVGVAAPQYGQRRSYFVGLSYRF